MLAAAAAAASSTRCTSVCLSVCRSVCPCVICQSRHLVRPLCWQVRKLARRHDGGKQVGQDGGISFGAVGIPGRLDTIHILANQVCGLPRASQSDVRALALPDHVLF
jgi:hypothetical protein